MKRLTPRPSLVFSTTSGPLRVIRQGWVRSGARRKRDNGATGGTVPAQHSETGYALTAAIKCAINST